MSNHEPTHWDNDNPLLIGWAKPRPKPSRKVGYLPVRALIRSLSGATPNLEGFAVEAIDGNIHVWLDTPADLWRLREVCGHDIAITADGLLVVDDYWD